MSLVYNLCMYKIREQIQKKALDAIAIHFEIDSFVLRTFTVFNLITKCFN